MNTQNIIIELKEEYPEFFEAFPLPLIEFALSEKTAEKIASICIENKITDEETVEGVAFRVTYVLFDKLPKENLAITLTDGLKIDKEKAEKITKATDKIIFSELPKILNSEQEQEERMEREEREIPPQSEKTGDDVYREPIE